VESHLVTQTRPFRDKAVTFGDKRCSEERMKHHASKKRMVRLYNKIKRESNFFFDKKCIGMLRFARANRLERVSVNNTPYT